MKAAWILLLLSFAPCWADSAEPLTLVASAEVPTHGVVLKKSPLDASAARWFWPSVAWHGAGTAADAFSSWNRPEANPVLAGRQGRFDGRGVAIKAGIFAGLTGLEVLTLRYLPDPRIRRVMIAINGVLGANYFILAGRNARLR